MFTESFALCCETVSDERVKGRFEEGKAVDLGVPQNILEREDEREECFNPEEKIVSEVIGYETSLQNRSGLAHLVENYGLLGHVLVRPTRTRERGCSTPGDYWMPMYSHYMTTRLWFPIPELLVWVLMEWDKMDAELENLSQWKAKRVNPNEYSLTPRELEDVKTLEKGDEGILDVMEYMSQRMLDAVLISVLTLFYFAEEMNKFLEATGGIGICKKGKGKRAEVGRQGEVSSASQPEVQTLVVSQPNNVGDEVTIAKEGPVGTSTTTVKVTAELKEQGYIGLQTTSFYDSRMRSIGKKFINAYFPKVDRQCARDKVAVKGSVGVVRQALKLRKENVELIKKNEEAELEVAKLRSEMEELRKENATLKRNSELSHEKWKIWEDELKKKEKELDEVIRAVAELELKVHNSVEEHVAEFLKSNTFEDIIKLYQLPTTIVAFSDCQKKVKLQYPDVDVMKITFRDQEGEVEEDGESSTVDFCPEVMLKWDRDNRGRTFFPSNFILEFVRWMTKGAKVLTNWINLLNNSSLHSSL
ncbi:hypothetical protein SLEP1_g44115 [Rubroshorea leprosula]|uniref:Uncharacterized protein n=1 Tax=Rubroshorea leprosula TaxID=152421 RepID=A0AAV5LFU7_9ROSI|nr:hypothetical protein SLEP1_g44115 [Rubroshorea leprosula]